MSTAEKPKYRYLKTDMSEYLLSVNDSAYEIAGYGWVKQPHCQWFSEKEYLKAEEENEELHK